MQKAASTPSHLQKQLFDADSEAGNAFQYFKHITAFEVVRM